MAHSFCFWQCATAWWMWTFHLHATKYLPFNKSRIKSNYLSHSNKPDTHKLNALCVAQAAIVVNYIQYCHHYFCTLSWRGNESIRVPAVVWAFVSDSAKYRALFNPKLNNKERRKQPTLEWCLGEKLLQSFVQNCFHPNKMCAVAFEVVFFLSSCKCSEAAHRANFFFSPLFSSYIIGSLSLCYLLIVLTCFTGLFLFRFGLHSHATNSMKFFKWLNDLYMRIKWFSSSRMWNIS